MTNLQLQANQFRLDQSKHSENIRHNQAGERNDAYRNQTGRLSYELEKQFQPFRIAESKSKTFSNYATPVAKTVGAAIK